MSLNYIISKATVKKEFLEKGIKVNKVVPVFTFGSRTDATLKHIIDLIDLRDNYKTTCREIHAIMQKKGELVDYNLENPFTPPQDLDLDDFCSEPMEVETSKMPEILKEIAKPIETPKMTELSKEVTKETPKVIETPKETSKVIETPKETPKVIETPKETTKPKETPKVIETPKETMKPKETPKVIETPKETMKPKETVKIPETPKPKKTSGKTLPINGHNKFKLWNIDDIKKAYVANLPKPPIETVTYTVFKAQSVEYFKDFQRYKSIFLEDPELFMGQIFRIDGKELLGKFRLILCDDLNVPKRTNDGVLYFMSVHDAKVLDALHLFESPDAIIKQRDKNGRKSKKASNGFKTIKSTNYNSITEMFQSKEEEEDEIKELKEKVSSADALTKRILALPDESNENTDSENESIEDDEKPNASEYRAVFSKEEAKKPQVKKPEHKVTKPDQLKTTPIVQATQPPVKSKIVPDICFDCANVVKPGEFKNEFRTCPKCKTKFHFYCLKPLLDNFNANGEITHCRNCPRSLDRGNLSEKAKEVRTLIHEHVTEHSKVPKPIGSNLESKLEYTSNELKSAQTTNGGLVEELKVIKEELKIYKGKMDEKVKEVAKHKETISQHETELGNLKRKAITTNEELQSIKKAKMDSVTQLSDRIIQFETSQSQMTFEFEKLRKEKDDLLLLKTLMENQRRELENSLIGKTKDVEDMYAQLQIANEYAKNNKNHIQMDQFLNNFKRIFSQSQGAMLDVLNSFQDLCRMSPITDMIACLNQSGYQLTKEQSEFFSIQNHITNNSLEWYNNVLTTDQSQKLVAYGRYGENLFPTNPVILEPYVFNDTGFSNFSDAELLNLH
jgi:hypothetical protein